MTPKRRAISFRSSHPGPIHYRMAAKSVMVLVLVLGLGGPGPRSARAQSPVPLSQPKSLEASAVQPAVARLPLPKPAAASKGLEASGATQDLAPRRSSTQGVFGTLSSLGVVLCLFVGLVFLLRRILPESSKKKLPAEVLEVIGTMQWSPKQQWVLMRFGRKLLLVSQQSGETRVVAEESDPAEIDRMIALCEKPHRNDAAFSSYSLESLWNRQRATTD